MTKTGAMKYDRNMRIDAITDSKLEWRRIPHEPIEIEGFGWFQKEKIFRRLPHRPKHQITEAVDALANCTTGGQLRFQTDAKQLSVSVRLANPANMYHMPATGQCGFDCYIGGPRQKRYQGTTRFDHTKNSYESPLFDFPYGELREVTVNLPLYQGVNQIEIGLTPGACLLAPSPRRRPEPVVVYGTSITQGGCANRPGMAYTNILSRRLDVPFINLGFSGSGRGEPEVAHIITEIENPSLYILDFDGNVSAESNLGALLDDFIRILRVKQPLVPILVISRVCYIMEAIGIAGADTFRIERRDAQSEVVDRRCAAGDKNLFFVDGGELFGQDFDECTVDGTHPTDLGFMRMADHLEPVCEKLLFPIVEASA